MHKLKIVVYIAGTINGLPIQEVVERFGALKTRLEMDGFEVLSPLRKKSLLTDADYWQFSPNEIVHRDLTDIDRANILLVIKTHPSIGASMEIMYARYVRHIPVILVSDNPAVTNHYWIRALSSKICKTVDEGIEYLKWFVRED